MVSGIYGPQRDLLNQQIAAEGASAAARAKQMADVYGQLAQYVQGQPGAIQDIYRNAAGDMAKFSQGLSDGANLSASQASAAEQANLNYLGSPQTATPYGSGGKIAEAGQQIAGALETAGAGWGSYAATLPGIYSRMGTMNIEQMMRESADREQKMRTEGLAPLASEQAKAVSDYVLQLMSEREKEKADYGGQYDPQDRLKNLFSLADLMIKIQPKPTKPIAPPKIDPRASADLGYLVDVYGQPVPGRGGKRIPYTSATVRQHEADVRRQQAHQSFTDALAFARYQTGQGQFWTVAKTKKGWVAVPTGKLSQRAIEQQAKQSQLDFGNATQLARLYSTQTGTSYEVRRDPKTGFWYPWGTGKPTSAADLAQQRLGLTQQGLGLQQQRIGLQQQGLDLRGQQITLETQRHDDQVAENLSKSSGQLYLPDYGTHRPRPTGLPYKPLQLQEQRLQETIQTRHDREADQLAAKTGTIWYWNGNKMVDSGQQTLGSKQDDRNYAVKVAALDARLKGKTKGRNFTPTQVSKLNARAGTFARGAWQGYFVYPFSDNPISDREVQSLLQSARRGTQSVNGRTGNDIQLEDLQAAGMIDKQVMTYPEALRYMVEQWGIPASIASTALNRYWTAPNAGNPRAPNDPGRPYAQPIGPPAPGKTRAGPFPKGAAGYSPAAYPGPGPKSLQSAMAPMYNFAMSLGLKDMGTYNPNSRLPQSGKPSDHATYPAYAFDAGSGTNQGWNDPTMRQFATAMAGAPGVNYVILGDRIWSRSKGWHAYTSGGHENHVHVSGVHGFKYNPQQEPPAAGLATPSGPVQQLLQKYPVSTYGKTDYSAVGQSYGKREGYGLTDYSAYTVPAQALSGYTSYVGARPPVARVIAQTAPKHKLDPVAVLAYALEESGGNWQAVGDKGTSFGPFQAHRGGALGSHSPEWAMSPQGLDEMMGMMARAGVRGSGRAALWQIYQRFGRGANNRAAYKKALRYWTQAQQMVASAARGGS
jgi:hypothetical protein